MKNLIASAAENTAKFLFRLPEGGGETELVTAAITTLKENNLNADILSQNEAALIDTIRDFEHLIQEAGGEVNDQVIQAALNAIAEFDNEHFMKTSADDGRREATAIDPDLAFDLGQKLNRLAANLIAGGEASNDKFSQRLLSLDIDGDQDSRPEVIAMRNALQECRTAKLATMPEGMPPHIAKAFASLVEDQILARVTKFENAYWGGIEMDEVQAVVKSISQDPRLDFGPFVCSENAPTLDKEGLVTVFTNPNLNLSKVVKYHGSRTLAVSKLIHDPIMDAIKGPNIIAMREWHQVLAANPQTSDGRFTSLLASKISDMETSGSDSLAESVALRFNDQVPAAVRNTAAAAEYKAFLTNLAETKAGLSGDIAAPDADLVQMNVAAQNALREAETFGQFVDGKLGTYPLNQQLNIVNALQKAGAPEGPKLTAYLVGQFRDRLDNATVAQLGRWRTALETSALENSPLVASLAKRMTELASEAAQESRTAEAQAVAEGVAQAKEVAENATMVKVAMENATRVLLDVNMGENFNWSPDLVFKAEGGNGGLAVDRDWLTEGARYTYVATTPSNAKVTMGISEDGSVVVEGGDFSVTLNEPNGEAFGEAINAAEEAANKAQAVIDAKVAATQANIEAGETAYLDGEDVNIADVDATSRAVGTEKATPKKMLAIAPGVEIDLLQPVRVSSYAEESGVSLRAHGDINKKIDAATLGTEFICPGGGIYKTGEQLHCNNPDHEELTFICVQPKDGGPKMWAWARCFENYDVA